MSDQHLAVEYATPLDDGVTEHTGVYHDLRQYVDVIAYGYAAETRHRTPRRTITQKSKPFPTNTATCPNVDTVAYRRLAADNCAGLDMAISADTDAIVKEDTAFDNTRFADFHTCADMSISRDTRRGRE